MNGALNSLELQDVSLVFLLLYARASVDLISNDSYFIEAQKATNIK